MQKKVFLASAIAVILVMGGLFSYQKTLKGDDASGPNAAAAQRQGPPPAAVATAKAVFKNLAPQSETPGSVVSTRDSLVASATAGKIEWVADVGAEVSSGDVIARIEQSDAKYARDDAAAQVNRLHARAQYQNALVKRFEGLGADAGESESTMDEMRANRDEAREALAQARVALRRATINVERTEVKAPFTGRVVRQESQIGEYANTGTELIRLVDTEKLEVTARAPASIVKNVKTGAMIPVVNGTEKAEAKLRAIVPVGDSLSRLLELRLELPNADWYIGSAVRVRLPSAQPRQVTAVPRDALVLRADRVSIFVVNEDKTARRVDVELGTAEGQFIEVIGDIKQGDEVVIRGGERLRDGQLVTISTVDIADDVKA